MRGGKSYDYHNFCYVSFHVEKMKHHRLRRSFPCFSFGVEVVIAVIMARIYSCFYLCFLAPARPAPLSAPDLRSPRYPLPSSDIVHIHFFYGFRHPDTFSPCCVLLFACVFGGFRRKQGARTSWPDCESESDSKTSCILMRILIAAH